MPGNNRLFSTKLKRKGENFQPIFLPNLSNSSLKLDTLQPQKQESEGAGVRRDSLSPKEQI